jgi:hypothetical protein
MVILNAQGLLTSELSLARPVERLRSTSTYLTPLSKSFESSCNKYFEEYPFEMEYDTAWSGFIWVPSGKGGGDQVRCLVTLRGSRPIRPGHSVIRHDVGPWTNIMRSPRAFIPSIR